MYVTRPLSLYRNFPDARSEQPPPDPCSGYLIVTDEEADERDYFCWGLCKKKKISKLPLPQDRILKVVHLSEHDDPSETKLWFIPVLDQPLSSNRYYAIRASGKYKGYAITCSREDDVAGCCFPDVVRDLRPKQFNHRDIYQQFEIRRHCKGGGFYAESVAGDGFPPKFLRRKGWELYISTSLQLREARGLNTRAQMQLPGRNFPAYYKCSPPVVVAKWYCPFVFVKDQLGNVDREEARKSMVYEMTLEQWWEEIYSCENESNGGNTVNASAVVQRESVLVCGVEAVRGYGDVDDDGLVWFRVEGHGRWPARRGEALGLSSAVVEKMKWVEETRRGGGGGEKEVRVQIVEEAASGGAWKKFGCYVLVESFVLRRMDGLVMLSCKFRHVHRTICKWE
ncbi:uncharacterized protein LOC127804085 [Diospyros lotus]|uniref:uncharacterized protein LOC127804085 n=1 Tax=Diospyros lotus TaxID=55363 RepID=UPI00224ED342|nr:uncharacterized protein LOC127804085 [Diospyros lotus]